MMPPFMQIGISIGIFLVSEALNCAFPYYSENIWSEKSNGIYHENIGCFCSWEKEDFVYNADTGKWDLAPDASRKRGKKGKGRRRGGNGLR
jgi:hypothetical protein